MKEFIQKQIIQLKQNSDVQLSEMLHIAHSGVQNEYITGNIGAVICVFSRFTYIISRCELKLRLMVISSKRRGS